MQLEHEMAQRSRLCFPCFGKLVLRVAPFEATFVGDAVDLLECSVDPCLNGFRVEMRVFTYDTRSNSGQLIHP